VYVESERPLANELSLARLVALERDGIRGEVVRDA
jgi:hypothetical protein